MGANMARRLKDCGYQISCVYDVNRGLASTLANELECRNCLSLADVSNNSDIIITVVPDDDAMFEVFSTGHDNLLIGASGKIFINCATVSPDTHREIEKQAAEKGAKVIEALMASSIPQARNGELYLMVGGDKDLVEEVKPVLEDLSSTLRYIGPSGRAAEMKALVNMVMNINTAALAEGLALASALGQDLTTVREVFSETGAASRVLVTDGEDMQNSEHDCYFSAEHAAKDSGIANTLATRKGMDLPLNEATLKQYKRMIEVGLGQLDKSGIAELTFLDRGPDTKRTS